MKTKSMAIILVLFFIFSLSGCGGTKDPIERLEVAFAQSAEMDFASQAFDYTFFFETEEPSPEFDMITGMLNGLNISGNMDVNQKDMMFAGIMTARVSGVSYDLELYKGEEYFLKVPLFDQYIIITDEEQSAEIFNTEMMETLNKDMMDIMFSQIDSSNLETGEEITIEQNNESVSVTPIAVSLTDQEAKEVFREVIDFLMRNDAFSQQMKTSMETEMKMMDPEITEEEIQELYEEAMVEMDNAFNMLYESISIEKFDAVYFLDKDNHIRRSEADYQLVVDMNLISQQASSTTDMSEEEREEMEAFMAEMPSMPVLIVNINGTSDVFNINQEVVLEIPEITPENSIGIEGLTGLPMQ